VSRECEPPIILAMRREEAIAALRGYLPAIRRDFGVRRIALFGSTARGDAREDSDLDILVDFEKDPTFLSFMGLKAFLEDHLGRKVDLVTPDALKPRMRPIVEREAVDVAQG
jgi:predicted nucleotidyltransferase